MTHNVGNTDRIVRIILGVALIVAVVYFQSWLLGIVALIPLATALMKWCPLYALFHHSTRPAKTSH
ncbi:MAG: DUF2892 domain-containing protein [Anaerolineae bacterium]|nr:DUF2892 domain-containing protein [Anaerolineae bacterium]